MKLFSYVVNRQIDVAVITYRLTRFGFAGVFLQAPRRENRGCPW